MPHIAILVHQHDTANVNYFLTEMAEFWRADGLSVSVVRGLRQHINADLAILHVDTTVTPPAYVALARRYPIVLNREVTDISKRRISTNLVKPGDGYDGPVIVKTNKNYGGREEARLAARGSPVRRLVRSLRGVLPWTLRSELPIANYPIFDTAARVPRTVWHNPDLVVERFLPEHRDGYYCLRTWVFLGDRETNSIVYSDQPVVKADTATRRQEVDEVPEELRRIRRELGFDFGKFDYVIADGRVVLYDANRTPTLGVIPRDVYLPRIRLLAEGIRLYL